MLVVVLAGIAVTAFASTRVQSWIEATAALAICVAAYRWFLPRIPEPGVSSFRPVLDGITFDIWQSKGQGSSVLLSNGGAFPDMLLGVHQLGGDNHSAGLLLAGSISVAFGVLFLFTSRMTRPSAAAPAVLLALALLIQAHDMRIFGFFLPVIDTSSTFLFCTLSAIALLSFALDPKPAAMVVAGVCAANAFGGHVSGVCLAPALIFVPAMASLRPAQSTGLAIGSFLGATVITSWDALTGNILAMNSSRLIFVALAGVPVLYVAGTKLAATFRRLSAVGRMALVGAGLLLSYISGLLAVLFFRRLRSEYIVPAIAPLSVLVAVLLTSSVARLRLPRASRWVELGTALAVGLLLLGFQVRGSSPAGGVAPPGGGPQPTPGAPP
jgi:hypothetical protein